MVDCACEYKKIVAKTVDIADYLRVNFCIVAEGDDATFSATGDAARDMSAGRILASAWQNKPVVSWQGTVEPVDCLLDFCDGVRRQRLGLPVAFGFGGEHGSYVKQSVLNLVEDGLIFGTHKLACAYESEPGVEFVDSSIGFEASGVFGDSRAADERSRSAVA